MKTREWIRILWRWWEIPHWVGRICYYKFGMYVKRTGKSNPNKWREDLEKYKKRKGIK